MKMLLGFIGIIVVLWFLWVWSGGPGRYDQNSGPYINPPSPIGPGGTYGPVR